MTKRLKEGYEKWGLELSREKKFITVDSESGEIDLEGKHTKSCNTYVQSLTKTPLALKI